MLSIITPVLNGAEYIENNIKAVMGLDIPFEHIIVDGGSTDGTIGIVNKYSHLQLLFQQGNTGMYGAIHQGFMFAKGKYYAYINADDIIIKSGFEKMYKRIYRSGIDIVYSDSILHYVDTAKYKKYSANRFAKYFLKHGIMPFIQPSCIFSEKIYYNVGGFNYKSFMIIGDLDLFRRYACFSKCKYLYIRSYSSYFMVRKNSFGNLNTANVSVEKSMFNIPIPSIWTRFLYKVTSYL
jgi:glycosyltransferase involved in cell wall biosynthesis